MVLETHVGVRLDVAHGSQGQGRKQILVTKTLADPAGEFAREILSRRFFQQFEQRYHGSSRIGKAAPADKD
jgi:hypothetical protein